MPIHVNQVLDYLDTHPICREADSVESLLGMLHDIYASHNHFNSGEIREKFHKIRDLLGNLTQREFDDVFCVVCDLCLEHEQLAFSQGVLAGMLLMTEVNRLP